MEKTDLKYEARFEEKVSRLFIFRFLWIYIEMWVIIGWAIWMAIVGFLHFWYMLILGKRSECLWKKQMRFSRNISKWQAYINGLIDRRPNFIED